MTFRSEDELVRFCHRLTVATNVAVRAVYKADTCYLQTRVAVEAADYFGVALRPVGASVTIYNRPLWERLDALDEGEELGPLRDEEWSVGMGFGVSGPERGTHCVAYHDGAGLVLDPSLDQASRPQRGIVVGPSIVRAEPEGETIVTNGELVLVYHLDPGDMTRLGTPDWTRNWRPFVGPVIRIMKKQE
jgi:hypothetical protein